MNPKKPKEKGYFIYTKSIKTRSGRVIRAEWYGLKAFKIWIKAA